jgi:hypothetical protein
VRILFQLAFITILVTKLAAADFEFPRPFTSRKAIPFSKLGPEERGKLGAVRVVAVTGPDGEVRTALTDGLRAEGLSVTYGDCRNCDAILSVDKVDEKHWIVMMYWPKMSPSRLLNLIPGPVTKDWYADCEYTVTLRLPSAADPIFVQKTVVVTAAKPDSAKPPEIPSAADLTGELLPVLSGMLGRVGPLERMLNDDAAKRRREAIEILQQVGSPVARSLLEKRLGIETVRSFKSKIKSALKDMK